MNGSPQISTVARAWVLFCILTEQMSRGHGLTIRPTSYLRTAEEQKRLFDQKLTPCDGTTRRSAHQDSRAMDFIVEGLDGKPLPLENHAYAIMGVAWCMLDPRNVWGGAWLMPNGKPDVVHCEYRP
jgi:hypothetical protein